MGRMRAGALGVLVMAGVVAFAPATQVTAAAGKAAAEPVAEHWTAARMKAATPRDLVLDERGLAYLKQKDGTLEPHGHATRQLHATPVSKPTANAKPGGGGTGDTTPPSVTKVSPPITGATIGASHTFSATVTDVGSGVRSVTFTIRYPGGSTQSFTPSASGSTFSINLSGFTNGSWSWQVTARDNATKNGNVTNSGYSPFTVDTSGGGSGTTTVTNSRYTGGGAVQSAAGRIYFEMPTNASRTSWAGYVCSGTVAADTTSGRSVIITAAHCVYDDEHKVFARNVMFIPNQDFGTDRTDQDCTNDPMGCWKPSFGVVDTEWANKVFPANIPWDYAFYVVKDSGQHYGTGTNETLDSAAGSLPVQTSSNPTAGTYTHALGYSYSDDPNFMYCAEGIATEPTYQDWWLDQCGLSGGASGGPWIPSLTNGTGSIVSVNSFGYTNRAGMGGPKLTGAGGASCVFDQAKAQSFGTTQAPNPGAVVC